MSEYIMRESGYPGTLSHEVVGELIRCKDCKHWEGEKRGRFWYFEQCSLNQHIASCDDYCSFAERKEGADG